MSDKYIDSRLRVIKTLHESYDFKKPFSKYLQEFFRAHKEMGSRDRREIRDLIFNLLRLGKNLEELPFSERVAVAVYLCNDQLSDFQKSLVGKYSSLGISENSYSFDERIYSVMHVYSSFNLRSIFPMSYLLSNEIETDKWSKSFLRKPNVWIRIRKGYFEEVIKELEERKISYIIRNDFVSTESDAPLDKTESYRRGLFEIQDSSSQQVLHYLDVKANDYWWDCCAGSGGKSLLLKEINSGVRILATDVRKNILENYIERMKRGGHNNFMTRLHDASLPLQTKEMFDGIIADVPCSGSGTWSRSPEWLRVNIEDRISQHFIPLQREIIFNVQKSLKAGRPLVYITCSVFKKENEENVQFFRENFPLRLEKSAYLEGYESGGDTLFVARFIKI